jgi:hypothetical protein
MLGTVALRIAIGILRTIGTTTSVFGWLSLLPALFRVRTGGWEFIGRILEESSPVPVILVTISKYQTELGSLVSGSRTVT